MKKIYYLLSLIALLSSTSCATIISGSKQNLALNSEPSKAKVFLNGNEIGLTPINTSVLRKKEYIVRIELDGYKPYEVKLEKKFNSWYIGNVLFGGIIGLVIDPITGALFKLKPTAVENNKDMAYETNNKNIKITVTLSPDERDKQIGQLEKL